MKKFIWLGEACDLPAEPETGTFTTRFTSAVMANINIYCEQPYATPDGKRFAILRSPYADPRLPPSELLVAEIGTLRLALIERRVESNLVATAGYSGILYYIADRQLQSINLATMEHRVLFPWTLPDLMGFDSATPDGKYLIGTLCEPDFSSSIVRLDLKDGRVKKIFNHRELLCHVQVNPVNGRDILVQHNRGDSRNDNWERKQVETQYAGATHFMIDIEGNNFRPLAIGEPHTSGTTGHSSWVADTGRIGVSTAYHWHSVFKPGKLDERYPDGNFFTVGPDDKKPVNFRSPEHRFNHVNVSRDGKYFVCDCYHKGIPGNIEIVVGNIRTGRHRILLADCGAQGGCAACSHPHPYLMADNRHVIFNADRHGVPHVYAAHVTEEFLKSLE